MASGGLNKTGGHSKPGALSPDKGKGLSPGGGFSE